MTTTLDFIIQSGMEVTPEGKNTKADFVGMSSNEMSDLEQKQEEEDRSSHVAGDNRRSNVTAALSQFVAAADNNSSSNNNNDSPLQEQENLNNQPEDRGTEGLEDLISRWCQSQNSVSTQSKPNEEVFSTALLLLQMQKLENRMQQQENQIKSLQRSLLEQHSGIQSDLTRILTYMAASTRQFPPSSRESSLSHGATNGSHHQAHQPLQQEIVVTPPLHMESAEINVVNSHNVSHRSNLGGGFSNLHPSSVFTSVRTTERQPPKPPQRHDSIRSRDRPMLATTQSGISNSDLSSANSSVDKFVFHPPKMNPRARGPGNNNNNPLKSRNSLRNNRAQQLEIIWDASEHTTNNKHENAPRNNINISYDPKDLFKQDTGKNNNLHDSILSGATRAFSNVHNKGMHDSILTGVSFMDEEGEDEEEELVPHDADTKVDEKANNNDDELKSSSGHSLSRFLKNTIKKGEKRDRRFSTKKIQWKRSELKKETSPVIPKRVASMKREHVVDVLDEDHDAGSGGDNIPSNDTEIPLNLTDSDIQGHDTDAVVENDNADKNGMDTSNNDNTIKTPLPQVPPTKPPPISTRRTSDFHPPSPPPRHRKFFPRTRGIMPTLVNSKREIFISGGSSRLQLSSLTLDTALPSSDAGSVLREVTNSTLTDKCNERGKYTGTVNENDEPDGYGTMTYSNGAFYKGTHRVNFSLSDFFCSFCLTFLVNHFPSSGDWKDGHW